MTPRNTTSDDTPSSTGRLPALPSEPEAWTRWEGQQSPTSSVLAEKMPMWRDFTVLYTRVGARTRRSIAWQTNTAFEILTSDIFGKQQYLKRVVGHHFPPVFFSLLFIVPLCMHSAGVHRSTFIYNIAPFFLYIVCYYTGTQPLACTL